MHQRVPTPARALARAFGRWATGSPRAVAGAALLALAAIWALAAAAVLTAGPEGGPAGLVYEPAAEVPAALEPLRHDVYIGFANLPAPAPRQRLDANEPVRRLRAIELPERREVAVAAPSDPAAAVEPLPRTSTEPQPAPSLSRRAPASAWIAPGEFLESPLAVAAAPQLRVETGAAAPTPGVTAPAAPPPVASGPVRTAAAAPIEPVVKPVAVAAVGASPKPVAPAPAIVPAVPKLASPAPVKPVVKPAPGAVAEPIATPRPIASSRPIATPQPVATPPPVAVAEPLPVVRPVPAAPTPPGLDIVLGRNADVARPAPPPVALPTQPVSPIGGSVVAAIGDLFAAGERPGVAAHGAPASLRPVLLFAIGEDVILVPEPGTLLLLGGGLLALGLAGRRR